MALHCRHSHGAILRLLPLCCMILILLISFISYVEGQNQPSPRPTAKPSASPTLYMPTFSPTPGPTARPTANPSVPPTAKPTYTYKPTQSYKPSRQPTFAPSAKPTIAPSQSVKPSLLPTPLPSRIPSPLPTRSPTYVPTAMDPYAIPSLSVPAVFTFQLNYFCHPLHYRSGLNVFQTVFEGIVVTAPAQIQYAYVQLSPYDDEIDQLGMVDNDFDNTVRVTYKSGMLTIAQETSDLVVETVTDWTYLLSKAAYRLGVEGGKLRSCYAYTEGRLPARSISVYVVDMFGRYSNKITVSIIIETATLMYTDDVSTITSNAITTTSLLEPSDAFAVDMTYLMTQAEDAQ